MFISAASDLVAGVGGGAIIAAASSLLLYLEGKITGISGILSGSLSHEKDWKFRAVYILGLLAAGALVGRAMPEALGDASTLKTPYLVLAGLLVGFGTRLSHGCTSGHGVCGIPRLSPRSLLAVGTFMATGAVTAGLVNSKALHSVLFDGSLAGRSAVSSSSSMGALEWAKLLLPTLAAAGVFLAVDPLVGQGAAVRKFHEIAAEQQVKEGSRAQLGQPLHPYDPLSPTAAAIAAGTSLLFGTGLLLSGMTNPSRVSGFLDFTGIQGWDLTLAGVMGGAVMLNALTFRLMSRPGLAPVCALPDSHGHKPSMDKIIVLGNQGNNSKVNARLLLGSAIFGIGWGLAGVCPGPALVSLGAGVASAATFVPSMILGMLLERVLM